MSVPFISKEERKMAKLLKEFSKLKSNAEKIQFVNSKLNEIDNSNAAIATMRAPKNNDQAKKSRSEGNNHFLNGNCVKALQLYNQSICFAESNTEDLGMGYANRSTIYLKWKKYDLCLENIKRAKQNGYPNRLLHKLNNRESECLVTMQESGEEVVDGNDSKPLTPTLSLPPHKKVPSAAECLELHKSQDFGRYIVTNKDLTAGQVVAVEDSFSAVLNQTQKYQRCANCLNEHHFNLIPCEDCTLTMFCGEKCATESQERFHRIECPIIDFLLDNFDESIVCLSALRASICAITSFGDLTALKNFIEDPETENINAFTLNYRDDMPSSERYKAIHTLETTQSKRTDAELFQVIAITAKLHRALVNHTPLAELLKTRAEREVFMELLMQHMQISQNNYMKLETLADVTAEENTGYGLGTFALSSLINHSCAPNTVRISCGQRIIVVVLRPIKAGNPLTDSYGIHYNKYELAERKNRILADYKFKCTCEACQKDFSDLSFLTQKEIANIPRILTLNDFLNTVLVPNRNFVRRNVSRFVDFMNEFDHYYPCHQLNGVEGCLMVCLQILYNYIPLEYKASNA